MRACFQYVNCDKGFQIMNTNKISTITGVKSFFDGFCIVVGFNIVFKILIFWHWN